MPSTDPLFMGLVLSLQSSAMVLLGKVMNPVTGNVDRDLESARQTIDLLAALQSKSQGNLSSEEARLLEHVLYDLRLNFVDESSRTAQPSPPESANS